MAPIDSWTRPSLVSPSSLVSPTRSSRSAPFPNEVAHKSFTRSHSNQSHSTEFSIGDAVVISANTKTRHSHSWLGSLSGKDATFVHEDGLKRAEKVGLIVGLYEDASGKMVRVRWFVRPKLIWTKGGPMSGLEVEPYELYYMADSTYLESQRTKSRKGNEFSTLRTSRESHCIESFSLSVIKSKAVITSSTVDPTASDVPTFLVKQIYDTSPLSGGEFIGDFDWTALHRTGMEAGIWDPEPIPGSDDEEEIIEPPKKKQKAKVVIADSSDSEEEGEEEEVEPSKKQPKQQKVERTMYFESNSEDEEEERPRASPAKKVVDQEALDAKNARALDRKARALETKKAKQLQRAIIAAEDDEEEPEEDSDDDEEDDIFDCSAPEESSQETSDEGEASVQGDASDEEDSSDEEYSSEESHAGRKRGRPSSTRAGASRSGVRPARPAALKKRSQAIAARRKQNIDARKSKSLQPRLVSAIVRPPAFDKLSTFEKARALLHVGATPDYLPCREEEREDIQARVGDALISQTGTCIYISGVPGTGKTATVRSVIKALQEDEDMESFEFLEINGMKIAEPNQAFSQLWEFLSEGKKATPRLALTQLENHFQQPDMNRHTTVVLVDELDQMVTKKQDVIYNFFNWPHIPHSRLIVIAIANTMDLPERELSGKIRSRLGSNRIKFKPYNWKQLEEILAARLEGLEVFDKAALMMAAKKVAGVSGDARRALDICRRTAEKVDQINTALIASGESTRLCTIPDVQSTYNEMTNYGSNFFVKRLGLTQKIMMLAIAQCTKRAGVPEVKAGDVISWHLDFLRQTAINPVPSHDELFTSLSTLHSLKLVATESQRIDYFQKVRSLVEDSDLFAALSTEPVLARHVPRYAS